MEYPDLIKKLENKEPFQFVRIGDGEMLCMDGAKGKNTDGHKYFVELGKMLRSIYKTKRDYYVGLQPVKHGLHNNGKKYPQDFINADILHNASIEGLLKPFFEVLHKRTVVIVGNSRHKRLPFIDALIEVPKVDAFQHMKDVWYAMEDIAKKQPDIVFLFSCGMMKGVLIDTLSKLYPQHTAIDTGSLFEPYLGFAIRKYHKKILEREEKVK